MLLSEDNHIHQQGKKQKHFLPDQYFGGDNGARTRDLLTASQALSQLSYTPIFKTSLL